MDVIEAISTRKSIRAFKPDPVPKEVLTEVMEAALGAPSWGNTQPWEFAILGGQVIKEVKAKLVERGATRTPPSPDIAWPEFEEPYLSRRREVGAKTFEIMGIGREDREKRLEWSLQMFGFFGAPNGIIIYIDRKLGPYSILDVGIVLQTLLLAAHGHGLGACPEAAVISYPDILRSVLGIPDSKQIVVGVAVGYPDPDAPINQLRTTREPLEKLATWHGF